MLFCFCFEIPIKMSEIGSFASSVLQWGTTEEIQALQGSCREHLRSVSSPAHSVRLWNPSLMIQPFSKSFSDLSSLLGQEQNFLTRLSAWLCPCLWIVFFFFGQISRTTPFFAGLIGSEWKVQISKSQNGSEGFSRKYVHFSLMLGNNRILSRLVLQLSLGEVSPLSPSSLPLSLLSSFETQPVLPFIVRGVDKKRLVQNHAWWIRKGHHFSFLRWPPPFVRKMTDSNDSQW